MDQKNEQKAPLRIKNLAELKRCIRPGTELVATSHRNLNEASGNGDVGHGQSSATGSEQIGGITVYNKQRLVCFVNNKLGSCIKIFYIRPSLTRKH